MEAERKPPSKRRIHDAIRTYGREICASGREGDWESALRGLGRLIQTGVNPNTLIYNAVIKACAKAHETDLALRLFNDMKKRDCIPNGDTYASLAVACKDRLEMSVDFFRRIIKEGDKVEAPPMNVVLGACVGSSQPRLALELFAELTPGRYVTNAFTYTALFSACEKLGEQREAMRLFGLMHEQGVQPETATYNALISCMVKKDFEIPLEIITQMRAQGVQPNSYTYNTMIRCLSRAGKLGKLFEIFKEMKEAGCAPDVVTYGCVMNSCNRVKKSEVVLQLWQDMQDNGIEPNMFTYNAAIKACDASPHYTEQALQLFRDLKERGIQASLLTYNIVITVCARGSAPELAHVFVDELKTQHQPDENTFCAAIQACSKTLDAEKALLYFQDMAHYGVKPRTITYNTLLYALVKAGQPEKALEIFHAMKESGTKPDASTYTTLIQGTTGEWPELLYNEMVERGIDIGKKVLGPLDKGRA